MPWLLAAALLALLVVLAYQLSPAGGASSPAEAPGGRPAAGDSPPPEERSYFPPDDPAARFPALVAQILEAHGGRARVNGLLTTRSFGEAILPGRAEPVPLTFFWKTPGLARYHLELPDAHQEVYVSGQRVWIAFTTQQRVLSSSEPQGAERIRLRRNAVMSQPAGRALLDLDALSFRGAGEVEGRPTFQIEVRHRGFVETLHFDQRHLLCLERSRSDADLEGGPQAIVARFGDFREVDGLALPFAQQTWQDGVLYSQLRIETIEANAGLLTDAFEPAWLSAATPSPR